MLSRNNPMNDSMEPLNTLVLNLGDDETATRQQAMSTLSEEHLTPQLVDLLLQALEISKPQLRVNVTQVLSKSEDFRVVAPLIDLLEYDRNGQVRSHAAIALGKLKDRSAILPLQSVLRDDPDPQVRCAAAKALKSFSLDGVVESLLAALDDSSHAVVDAAIDALHEKSKQEAASDILEVRLRESNIADKSKVVHNLARLDNPKTARLFMDLLPDSNPEIRLQAARFLGGMGWKLAKPDQWRTIELLTDIIEIDPSDDVRLEAVFAVGHFRSSQARTALILALDDRSAIVSEIARGWLREMGYDPQIFGKPCIKCDRTQQDHDIPFKTCLACDKVICEDHWLMHTLAGPFCSTSCQVAFLQDFSSH